MAQKTALLAGASGLVGKELLDVLLHEPAYDKVVALVRTPLQINNQKLKEVIIPDFDNLPEYASLLAAEDVYCCLGTTIKKAKTKESMHRIDVEYPLTLAKLAKDNGAQQFLVVSAMNANENAFFFYSRLKGTLEKRLTEIGFESLAIFRPSLLLGQRKEFRFGEYSAIKLYHLIASIPFFSQTNIAVEAQTVARSMYLMAQQHQEGTHVLTTIQMKNLIQEEHENGPKKEME